MFAAVPDHPEGFEPGRLCEGRQNCDGIHMLTSIIMLMRISAYTCLCPQGEAPRPHLRKAVDARFISLYGGASSAPWSQDHRQCGSDRVASWRSHSICRCSRNLRPLSSTIIGRPSAFAPEGRRSRLRAVRDQQYGRDPGRDDWVQPGPIDRQLEQNIGIGAEARGRHRRPRHASSHSRQACLSLQTWQR